MADTFLLEIVTPLRLILSEEVEEVVAPGEAGEFGVLKGHTLFLSPLKPGEITYKTADSTTGRLAIDRGYAEIGPGRATILVDSAESAGDIDIEKAREELKEADEGLKAFTPDNPEYREALRVFELASARVGVCEKAKE
ncbi:MAG: ATP synthase F1 subunit epsilon [Thermodesulfobacteriota bacterium]